MKKPRDYQRQKVYDAEIDCFGPHKERMSLDKIRAVVKEQSKRLNIPKTEVRDGRGRRSACFKTWQKQLCFPKHMRSMHVVCHELAHVTTPDSVSWHGKEFCAEMLRLVSEIMTIQDARNLYLSMKKKKCEIMKTALVCQIELWYSEAEQNTKQMWEKTWGVA